MTDKQQKEIFAKNLNNLLNEHQKSQREVALAIDVSPQTFNTWCQAIALPRMGKVQKLADYFHIPKSQLIDPAPAADQQQPAARPTLTPDETDLLSNYQKLNDYGKEEARKQVRNLSRLDEYKKGHDAPGSENAAG